MLKEFLSQKGISYRDKDVTVDRAAAQEMVSRTGQMGVPVTIIDGQTIIGFDRPQLERALAQSQAGAPSQPPPERPAFGAAIADAARVSAQRGLPPTVGAYVGSVHAGSTAERLGLATADIIVEVNMQRITNAADLERVLGGLQRGSRVAIVYLRGGREQTAEGTF